MNMMREIIKTLENNFIFEGNDVDYYADPSGGQVAANKKIEDGIRKIFKDKYAPEEPKEAVTQVAANKQTTKTTKKS